MSLLPPILKPKVQLTSHKATGIMFSIMYENILEIQKSFQGSYLDYLFLEESITQDVQS